MPGMVFGVTGALFLRVGCRAVYYMAVYYIGTRLMSACVVGPCCASCGQQVSPGRGHTSCSLSA